MASLPVEKGYHPERRSIRRFLVNCPASLRTAGGTYNGRITDLSERGARFEGSVLPPDGVDAMLDWGLNEVFCRVVWRKEGACGLNFEQEIPTYLVEDSAHSFIETAMPVAKYDNIPLGQKRARLGALRTTDDQA